MIFLLLIITSRAVGLNTQYGFPGTQIGLTEYDDYITFTSNARLIVQRGDSIYVVWRRFFEYGVVRTYYNFYDGSNWIFGTGDYGSIPICGSSYDIDKPGSLSLNSNGIATIAYSYCRNIDDNSKCSIAQEIVPGSGVFIHVDCPPPESIGASELFQPHVTVGYQDYVYVLALALGGGYDYSLFFCKSGDGGSSYSSWRYIAESGLGHCITASRWSQKVTISWQDSWFQESSDGGDTWSTPISFVEELPGTLKIPFNTSMLYDKYDRLHIIFCINDTDIPYFMGPKKIYHYCPDLTPHYSLVYEYMDTLTHQV
ncbi:hypothetical protein KAT73_02480, partial [candidate division WOR-3 bacterium]|nr:hypothetical protein [candidate division WOR-3 bacterium]